MIYGYCYHKEIHLCIKILRVTLNVQQQKCYQNGYIIQNDCAIILFCSVCLVCMHAAAFVRSRKPRHSWQKKNIILHDFLTFTDQKYTCDVSVMHWGKHNVLNALNSTTVCMSELNVLLVFPACRKFKYYASEAGTDLVNWVPRQI